MYIFLKQILVILPKKGYNKTQSLLRERPVQRKIGDEKI